MERSLFYILESICCSGILWLFFRTVIYQHTSLQTSRLFLVGSMFAAAIIPMLRIPVYSPDVIHYEAMQTENLPVVQDMIVQNADKPDILFIVYISALGFMLLNIFWQGSIVARLYRGGLRSRHKGYRLVINLKVKSPFSFFGTIYMNETTAAEDRDKIIAHELSHIRHRHSIDLMMAELLNSFMWFNPFIWISKNSLVEIHEYQADRDVLNSGYDITEYRTLIFKQSIGYNPDITNSLHNSLTKKRFIMMTKPNGGRYTLLKTAMVVPVVVALMALFSFTKRDAVYIETTAKAEVSAIASADKDMVATTEQTQNMQVTIEQANVNKQLNLAVTTTKSDEKPIVIVDGVRKDMKYLESLSSDQIASVNILKGKSATDLYGEDGKNGVMVVTIKDAAADGNGDKPATTGQVLTIKNSDSKNVVVNMKITDTSANLKGKATIRVRGASSSAHNDDKVLYIFDGKKIDNPNDISPDDIESMTVLNDAKSLEKYNAEGYKTVAVIVSKANKANATSGVAATGQKSKEVIRGASSSASNSKSLYLLDGKKIDNPNDISPNDIERVSVWKDAKVLKAYDADGYESIVLITSKPKANTISDIVVTGFQSETAVGDEVYSVVDVMPKFEGGDINSFRNWCLKSLKYPAEAMKNNEQGNIVASFVVEKDGSISNIGIVRGGSESLENEVKRLIKSAPKWTPGEHSGKPARVKMILPINFKLQ